MAYNVGTAFITVAPSFKNFQNQLGGGMVQPLAKSGEKAGAQAGKGFSARFTSALKVGGAVAAIGAGVAKGLYEVGQSFNDMRNTIVVGTGASGKALGELETSAKRLGRSTPSSFAEIGTAIADVNTRLGLTGKPLEDISQRFLNLSRVTGTDLQGNIASMTRVFGDWGVEAADQALTLDKLFYASQATGVGLDQLSGKVVQFGAPLRQFGFSLDESIALFGKWEKEGVNTDTVMAGLRAGLGKLSKSGKEPVKAFADVTAAIKNAVYDVVTSNGGNHLCHASH